ncbi:CRISPR-associated endonuclease Cas2 [Desulfonema magnum]|uniref:CRISPR-associated endoribonuclease Cas2 n=1 Tax=Desulfonema magnum TaxID=45655 RepID=A0A975GQZ4_9BACT|nr:CRISPR-associated endonuclease Cas2 [Desulfonema magnum]QTA90420.1 CRISPR-associated endonuclease Cas2 [Desulfonema magnum]
MKKSVIVAYDISDNKARGRVFRIMKSWRVGGQKSVHECRLTLREAEELYLQIAEHLNEKTDSLLMVWLQPYRKVLHRGLGNGDISSKVRHIG